jgi:hypothetical protein
VGHTLYRSYVSAPSHQPAEIHWPERLQSNS